MCIWLICTDSLAPSSAPRIKISSKTRFWRGNCCLDQNIKRMNIQPWIHYLCLIQILLKVKTYFFRFFGQKKSFQEFPIYDITSHLATRKLCQRLWKVFFHFVCSERLWCRVWSQLRIINQRQIIFSKIIRSLNNLTISSSLSLSSGNNIIIYFKFDFTVVVM